MPLLGGLKTACGTFTAEKSGCSRQAVFCQKTAGRLRRQLMPVSHGGRSAGGSSCSRVGTGRSAGERVRKKEWARAAVRRRLIHKSDKNEKPNCVWKSTNIIISRSGSRSTSSSRLYCTLCIIYAMFLSNKYKIYYRLFFSVMHNVVLRANINYFPIAAYYLFIIYPRS